jgi:ribosome-binding protein aMBF1 (putative translation factor)
MQSPREILLKRFGGRISRLREAEGWSRPALADKLGVGRHCVGRWERGERQPTLRLLLQMEKIFGVSIHELGLPGPMTVREEDAKGEAV